MPRLGSSAMGGVCPCSKAGISTAPEVLLMTLCMTTCADDVNLWFQARPAFPLLSYSGKYRGLTALKICGLLLPQAITGKGDMVSEFWLL